MFVKKLMPIDTLHLIDEVLSLVEEDERVPVAKEQHHDGDSTQPCARQYGVGTDDSLQYVLQQVQGNYRKEAADSCLLLNFYLWERDSPS